MHPELIELPGGFGVKSYGLCLAIAFLGGTILARRRAIRANADPSVIFTMAALAIVFGVGGARLFYVIHYWAFFAAKANPLLAILDFRKGGLEFLGGFLGGLGAIIGFLRIPRIPQRKGGLRPRLSVRLYLDILAPSLSWDWRLRVSDVSSTAAALGTFVSSRRHNKPSTLGRCVSPTVVLRSSGSGNGSS